MIVDREYRDSAGVLSELEFNVEMPSFLQLGRKRHTSRITFKSTVQQYTPEVV